VGWEVGKLDGLIDTNEPKAELAVIEAAAIGRLPLERA
jgi:hypothetical protein